MPNTNPKNCCQSLADVISPRFFKALCDPNRVSILARLAECCGPMTVTQVAECCPVNLSTVSRHLAQLREAGILTAHRQGKEVHYQVSTQKLVSTLRAMADAIEACCPGDPGQQERNSKQ